MEERCVGGLISMKKTGLSWFRGSITNIIAKSIAPIPPTWASVVVYCGMTVNWVGGKHSLRIVRVRTCPLSSPCPIDERISLQYVMVRFTKSSHATIGSVIWRLFGLRECNEENACLFDFVDAAFVPGIWLVKKRYAWPNDVPATGLVPKFGNQQDARRRFRI